ncbi:MAG: SDR family NAD(P)-dependent oxidoreductase [Polyangiaceae bacterium]
MTSRSLDKRGLVVIITGASSGIGRSLALGWAKRGACVVLSARDEVALAAVKREVEAAGGEALSEPGDVTDPAVRVRLIERVRRERGRIDVLVNNAGRGYYSATRDIDLAELESLFALNVVAPLHLTQLALDDLARSAGTVVMVSSVAGVVAVAKMGAYAATKFALEAIAMSLRAEVSELGVSVVVVRPGPVDTPFRANAFTRNTEAGVRVKNTKAQSPDDVAEQTIRAVEKHRAVVETSFFVRIASFGARVVPRIFRVVSARVT